MLCPYCDMEYTADRPCFCQPVFRETAASSRGTEASPEDSFEVRQALRIRVVPATGM